MVKSTKGGKIVRRIILDLGSEIFDSVIEAGIKKGILNQNEVNEYKLAFNEYQVFEKELQREKGTNYRFSDLKAVMPDNLWLKLNLKIADKLREEKRKTKHI